MKIIELDLTGCQYVYDIHEKIRIAFGFDDEYGHNWSAFWDMLWSECDADKVVIKGENSLPLDFNPSLITMHEILDDTVAFRKDNNLASFSYEVIN